MSSHAPLTARYETVCPDCGHSIREGDSITKANGPTQPWSHTHCPRESGTNTPVCGRCFQHTSISGACGCEGPP